MGICSVIFKTFFLIFRILNQTLFVSIVSLNLGCKPSIELIIF